MSITFLIPVYNEVKTIKKAIEEAIKIQIPSKEIVIIDNGSTDGTQKVIGEFKNYPSIKIILQKKNLGFGNSIREGFNQSSSEFIYLQFGDLEYDINSCFEMLKLAEKKNFDAVFGSRLKNIKSLGEFCKIIYKNPAYLATVICTFMINLFYNRNFTDIIGGKLYRKDTIINVLPVTSGPGFDFEFVSLICKKNLSVGEIFVNYKPRDNFSEKKIKFYHMFNAVYGIFKVKFFKND
jgi:glycosyltransferase involved in cell wall biosynthesis